MGVTEEINLHRSVSRAMSTFDVKDIDMMAIELEARKLRAEAVASGLRSLRNWTMTAFQAKQHQRPV